MYITADPWSEVCILEPFKNKGDQWEPDQDLYKPNDGGTANDKPAAKKPQPYTPVEGDPTVG